MQYLPLCLQFLKFSGKGFRWVIQKERNGIADLLFDGSKILLRGLPVGFEDFRIIPVYELIHPAANVGRRENFSAQSDNERFDDFLFHAFETGVFAVIGAI